MVYCHGFCTWRCLVPLQVAESPSDVWADWLALGSSSQAAHSWEEAIPDHCRFITTSSVCRGYFWPYIRCGLESHKLMTRKHKRTTINLLHAARTPTGLRPWGTLLSLALLWSQSACHSFDSNDVIPTEPDMMESPSDLADPSVPCAECFPLEQLPPTLRARAESLLLAGLDSEALYTVAATIKPMSRGFSIAEYPTDMPEPTTVGRSATDSVHLALW